MRNKVLAYHIARQSQGKSILRSME